MSAAERASGARERNYRVGGAAHTRSRTYTLTRTNAHKRAAGINEIAEPENGILASGPYDAIKHNTVT